MRKALQHLIYRLHNLSGRNRAIRLLRLGRDYLDLHAFDYALETPSFHIITQLLKGGHNIPLCDHLDARNSGSNHLSRRLTFLQRRYRTVWRRRAEKRST